MLQNTTGLGLRPKQSTEHRASAHKSKPDQVDGERRRMPAPPQNVGTEQPNEAT